MEIKELLERIDRAVTLDGEDAAIRIRAEYDPQAGSSAKVFPPTYPGENRQSPPRYHYEQRWLDGDPVQVVLLDTFQSQANRVEAALKERAAYLGLPQLVMECEVSSGDGQSRSVRISNLDAPHRSRDAYFLDSQIGDVAFDKSEIGEALSAASLEDSSAFLKYAPCDLIFGVWDSHRGNRIALKFPRSYSSEIVGWSSLPGKKAATKGDPLVLPSQDEISKEEWSAWRPDIPYPKEGKKRKLSALGHGMVPGDLDGTPGGVSVKSITRDAVISLTGLSRFGFHVDGKSVSMEGRTALAALAFAADRLAFGGAGIHLRSGSDLVLKSENVEWVRRGGVNEALELGRDASIELFKEARDRLASVGIGWASEPVLLTPKPELMKVIEQTFTVAELEPEE